MRISDWSSDVCSSDLWTGTDIVFEITKSGDRTELRFTHLGLVPAYECYDVCSDGWRTYIASLRDLVANGEGRPYSVDARTASEQELMSTAHTQRWERTDRALRGLGTQRARKDGV